MAQGVNITPRTNKDSDRNQHGNRSDCTPHQIIDSMHRFIQTLCILISLTTLISCSSFQKDWRTAVSAQSQTASTDLQGPWEGEWISEASGHRGALRCLVTKNPIETGHYDFHYWAKWGIFSGAFEAHYPVQQQGKDRWDFLGETDLGRLGGVYRHEGHATITHFQADYTSTKNDHGTFTMRRPE